MRSRILMVAGGNALAWRAGGVAMGPRRPWLGAIWGAAAAGLWGGGLVQAGEPGGDAFARAEWTPLFAGVEHAAVHLAKPRLIEAQVLRVQLGTPGLSVLATPGNGEEPGETTGEKTSRFLKRQRCQAAINAAPFDKVSTVEGLPLDISGLQVSAGEVVSPDGGYPALLFLGDGRARIQQGPFALGEIREAVCVFQVVLAEGNTVATDEKLHPRTGAGVSEDGRTLWLLVVDGRQVGRSEGCTTLEMAAWLHALGASSGINLDGGGTSTMAVEGAGGEPRVLNRPIHAGVPGLERPSGSHLGIRAAPLAPRGK